MAMGSAEIRDFTERGYLENTSILRIPLTWDWLFNHLELAPNVRITYAYLVSKVDPKTGGVTIPMETVGRSLGISYATVWKYIKCLEDLGYLKIDRKPSDRSTYYPKHTFIADVKNQ